MAKKVLRTSVSNTGTNTQRVALPWIIGIVVILGVGLLFALLYYNVRGPSPISGLLRLGGQERGHDDEALFSDGVPPAGGTHSNIWQNCGIYDTPIDTGNAVHSMEHGAVWITYQPDLSERDIDRLQDIVRGESYLLLSPYEALSSPVVLTAWEVQLELESANDGRIDDFIEQYRLGLDAPEPGASCVDGVGAPLR